jgi:hypothetical protein
MPSSPLESINSRFEYGLLDELGRLVNTGAYRSDDTNDILVGTVLDPKLPSTRYLIIVTLL